MKKITVFLAIAFVLLIFAGCSNQNEIRDELAALKIENENLKSELESINNLKNAGNESESITEAVTTEPPKAEDWKIKYYVDEFKQPTNQEYLSGINDFIGTFSNSATTNSKLIARFIVDKQSRGRRLNISLAITLFEYGNNKVVNSSSSNNVTYDIIMKSPDGEKHDLKGTMYSDGDRIYINDSYEDDVINALSEDGTVSFYIEQSDRRTTTYLFDVPTSNFAEEYELLETWEEP